jgi:hypothetical protein
MKKAITLIKYILLFIVLLGCSRKKDGIPKLSQEDLSINIPGYNIYEHSSLISYLVDSTIAHFHYKIIPGTNTVFEYYYKAPDSELIADDEFEQKIVFEIDGEHREFNYHDNSILKTKCLSIWTCMCPGPEDEDFRINKGRLMGRKVNDTLWNVSIDLVSHSSAFRATKIKTEFKVVN